jgi:hypothetical protein
MSGRSLAKRTFKHVERQKKGYNWHEYKSVAMPAMYKEYPAKTHAEHRRRVIKLYRDVMYSAPRIYEVGREGKEKKHTIPRS